jgi:cytochrome P450
MQRLRARHGANFRMRVLGNHLLVIGAPDSVREVLLDRDKNFSSERGWYQSIGKLFARGLMLRDFEEHRVDRRIMQTAFRTEAMRGYVETMQPQISAAIARWPRELRLYPALKQLTLDLASRIFLGLPLDRESTEVNRAFVAAVAASLAIVRREVPGLAFSRGMRGRRTLERFFGQLVRQRREHPASDLLSELCRSRSDEGERFSDREIVDHMIFLMMAAHDTTTSSLASVVHELLEQPDWQERVRDDIVARDAPLSWDDRAALPVLDRCFDEALRLRPAVPFVARRSLRACRIGEFEVPANTQLGVASLVTHHLPEYWSRPDRFDPDRFLPERAEHTAHSHLYYPFGGGAHNCIGLHFARIQVKAVLNELLRHHRVRAAVPGHRTRFAAVPIPYPRDGLPVILERA